MKFCINCGNQVEDTARFCHHCGSQTDVPVAPVVPPVVPTGDQPTPTPATETETPITSVEASSAATASTQLVNLLKSLPTKVKAAVLAVLVVIVALLVFLFINSRTIKLEKYLTFTESGYSGYGYVTASFDYESFMADYSGKLKVKSSNISSDDYLLYALLSNWADDDDDIAMEFFVEFISGSLDQSYSLSNGDVVTWTWTYAEALSTYFNRKVVVDDVTYTMSSLEEVESIDIFEYISLEFSGYSGYGYASLSVNDMLSTYYFELNDSSCLSNGDVITVTFNEYYAETLCYNFGICPAETTKDYVVSGLEEVQLIDLADCVTVSFGGISGSGRATIEVAEDYYYYYFSIDNSTNLSNGDVITIYVDEYYVEELAGETGKTFSSTSYTVEVSGLSEYVASLAELEASDYMDELKDAAVSIYADNTNFVDEGEELLDMEYVGSYFMYDEGDANHLFLIYKMTGKNEDVDSFTFYWYCNFADVLKHADGTFSTDTSVFYITKASKNKVEFSDYYYAGFYTVSEFYSAYIEEFVDELIIECSVSDELLAETADASE